MAKIATTLPINKFIMLLVYVKATPSIASKQVNDIVKTNLGWIQRIVDYLHTDEVLEEGKQAHKLRIQAVRFTLINDQLYIQSFKGPYLKCLIDAEA